MEARKLRFLRLKYHISLRELARACGISPQRISEIELTPGNISDKTVCRIHDGMEQVITQREAMVSSLRQDYTVHGHTIFDEVEESGYEL